VTDSRKVYESSNGSESTVQNHNGSNGQSDQPQSQPNLTSRTKQRIKDPRLKQFWRLIGRLIAKKDVLFNASAITFNLLICSVPFVLLIFSLFGYVLTFEDAFNELVRYGTEFFPKFSYETDSTDVFKGAITVETLIRPLVDKRRIFGIVGGVILMFFAQGLFATVKHVVFEVFEIRERKHPALEMIYNFFTFGLVGGVFLFFSVFLSILSIVSLDRISLPFFDIALEIGWIYDIINTFLPIVFIFLLFYTIFRYISEKRLEPMVAVVGSLFYTILFEIVRFSLGTYLDYAFEAYKYLYQGYAFLVLIGIWAYYSSALFVVASIVARAYREIFYQEPPLGVTNPEKPL
jgi:YihY family inner membrane protein